MKIFDYMNDLIFHLDKEQVIFFENLVQSNNVKTVLDLACGGGDLAILMAKWGADVTALDNSAYLVRNLERKGLRDGLSLKAVIGDMRDINSIYHHRCNLAVCIKNSLSRLLSAEDIWGTLAQIYLSLEPGGIIVIHTLNYEFLLKQEQYPIFIAEEYDRDFAVTLFFDIHAGENYGRLLFQSCLDCRPVHEVTIPVLPVSKKVINLWLAELGFERIENHHCFDGTKENLHLLTVARRPGLFNQPSKRKTGAEGRI